MRLQKVVYHRAGDKSGALIIEERKESEGNTCFANLLVSLSDLAGGFLGNAC